MDIQLITRVDSMAMSFGDEIQLLLSEGNVIEFASIPSCIYNYLDSMQG